MYRLVIACVLALVVALAGNALTKTPDQQPPSTETSCNGLSAAARGLCNAYCQAQDCDVHPRPSCERLRANFQRITGNSNFPCDRVACGQSGPQCDGDCPSGFVCASGAEGGPEGGPEGGGGDNVALCTCAVPCGDAQAPQCDGACPRGTVCSSGPELGGGEGGPEAATCSCLVPCGDAEAPACDGACPPGGVCAAGAEGGGSEGGPEVVTCNCLF